MLWDIPKSIKMMKVTLNKLLTLNVIMMMNLNVVLNTCIIIPEKRYQGLQTWILDSFKELHDVQAQRLAVAGIIIEEIRHNIYKETVFRCSAGIAQNKVCSLHIFVFYYIHISMIYILYECFN